MSVIAYGELAQSFGPSVLVEQCDFTIREPELSGSREEQEREGPLVLTCRYEFSTCDYCVTLHRIHCGGTQKSKAFVHAAEAGLIRSEM